jgi:hypothetical protein
VTGEQRRPSDDWRDLAADEDVDDAEEVASLLDEAPLEHLGSLMGTVVERIVGVLLHGVLPEPRQRLFHHLRAAAVRSPADGSALPIDGAGMLAASTLLTSLPGPTPRPAPAELARTWAPRAARIVDRLDDDVCHDWALACAAHGLDDLVEVFLEPPEPSPTAAALVRAVVAVVHDDADPAVARRAWESFVDGFPAAYDARGVLLSSLLHGTWAVHVRIGGGEPRGIPGALEAATGLGWDLS